MDRGVITLSGIFLGAIVLVIAVWVLNRRLKGTPIWTAVRASGCIALGAWALYNAAEGVWRGRIKYPRADEIYWRVIDSTAFWASFAVWIGLGAVLMGLGVRAIYVLIQPRLRRADH